MHSKFRHGLLLPVILFFLIQKSNSQNFPSGFSQVKIANNIGAPAGMAFAPDKRLFLLQQDGKILLFKNNRLVSKPFASIPVQFSGERGLLGMAFDPKFSVNNFVYLLYTVQSAPVHNRVSRFTASGDTLLIGSEQVLLDMDTLNSLYHNGGGIHFAPDGTLYIAIGDNARATPAQLIDNYYGKILRINSDGSIPAGNPFTGSAKARRVWAFGLRNPFNFAFQNGTGRLFVNDVGKDSWEEIDEATLPGKNFGWPNSEGPTNNPNYTNPLYAYAHGGNDSTGCAITGGTFFNPVATNYPPQYIGKYFFMDFCYNWINCLDLANGNKRSTFATSLQPGIGSCISLTAGPDGNLYYLSRSQNALYKIIYSTSQVPVITSQPLSQVVNQDQEATFIVSAAGVNPLSYQWRKNGVNIPGATASSYAISSVQPLDSGLYSVKISNSFGNATSGNAILKVSGINHSPTGVITLPTGSNLYRGGDVINFAGNATDPEDGVLVDSSFSWTIIFHHNEHSHPGPEVPQKVKSGSFVIPSIGETSDNVYYAIQLVVHDSKGATDTASFNIYPHKASITLNSKPQGMTLLLDGEPVLTPYTILGVTGVIRNIGVVSPQDMGMQPYSFSNWYHGGLAMQDIATPDSNSTYTATFVKSPVDNIKDIFPGVAGAGISDIIYGKNITFFVANDGIHGRELWKTDGTEARTVLVKDIVPGEAGASPIKLTNVYGTIYFAANDGINGQELWKTDGTEAGTVLVKDIFPGPTGSFPDNLINLKGILFFTSSSSSVTGTELWQSNGLVSGTSMVKDINPMGASKPDNLLAIDKILYFRANDGVKGAELWKTDGTTIGTSLVKDINPSGSTILHDLTNVNGFLYFSATVNSNRELWKSDGTANGTLLVKKINPYGSSDVDNLLYINGSLYFRAQDGVNGLELWRNDGTSLGTAMIKDINPFGSSAPASLTDFNGTLYFKARDLKGLELWKTDGTAAGTVLFKDINPGSSDSNPSLLTKVKNTLYFVADDGGHGPELWSTDGTLMATQMLIDLNPGKPGSSPSALTNINGTLYLLLDNGIIGSELWSYKASVLNAARYARFSEEEKETTEANDPASLQLFPVPVDDYLYIKTPGVIGSQGAIVNMLGNTVLEFKLSTVNETKLYLKDLAAGMYLVRIPLADGSAGYYKFLKN